MFATSSLSKMETDNLLQNGGKEKYYFTDER